MKIIDLTQTISPTMSIFPYSKPPVVRSLATCTEEGYAELELTLNTHQGTHMDAPAHGIAGGLTLDQFPPDHFLGAGVAIDCTEIDSAEIPPAVLASLNTADIDFILFHTGWSKTWNTEAYLKQPPTLSDALAEQLIQARIKGVGIDAFSIEDMMSLTIPIHKKLMQHQILIIENLTNLDQLIGQRFTLYCLPMKVEHSDGAPVRAIAVCA